MTLHSRCNSGRSLNPGRASSDGDSWAPLDFLGGRCFQTKPVAPVVACRGPFTRSTGTLREKFPGGQDRPAEKRLPTPHKFFRGCGAHEARYIPLHTGRLTPGCSERRQEGTGRGSRPVGTHTASKRGCEWRPRHRGRQPRRSGSASNRDRRREPLKRASAHAGARGNEPRIPTKGTPWAEPARFARGPRLTLCSLVAFEPYAGQRRLDQSQRYGHQMTVLIRFLDNRLVA